ncbi:uncharacterized protein J3D65DRAFT_676059 [Phyllosticta citribraziliensis]|uniref:Uncharacterized protein n=1 Tax=Phyllosticta citribraziliensis TaxID=989973 RepID=A0ABR1LXR1_9PEZI
MRFWATDASSKDQKDVENLKEDLPPPTQIVQGDGFLRKEVDAAKEEIGKLKDELQRQRDTSKRLDTELRCCKKQVTSYSSRLQGALGENSKLNSQLSEKTKSNELWKKEVTYFSIQSEQLSAQFEEAKNKIETLTQELRSFQLKAIEQAQSGWAAEEDTKVRDQIEALHGKIRYWAKTFCGPYLASVSCLCESNAPKLHGILCNVPGFSNPEALKRLRHPFLILAHRLCEHVRLHIFDNPFFLLSQLQQNGELSNGGRCLNDMYKLLLKANAFDAHAFRTQLLRSSFSKTGFSEFSFKEPLTCSDAATKTLISICEAFWNDAKMLLKPECPEKDKYQEKLLQIIEEAAQIRCHLATQRISYEWIPSANLVGQAFDVRSTLFKADRLNKLDDEEDEKCNGKPIRVVLSPYVVARGDSDGEEYDQERVICKAVVWVDDRNEDGDIEML